MDTFRNTSDYRPFPGTPSVFAKKNWKNQYFDPFFWLSLTIWTDCASILSRYQFRKGWILFIATIHNIEQHIWNKVLQNKIVWLVSLYHTIYLFDLRKKGWIIRTGVSRGLPRLYHVYSLLWLNLAFCLLLSPFWSTVETSTLRSLEININCC